MAKTWYPVIDYTQCSECGSCVSKCTHDVYNKIKAPTPVVVNPEACIDHCHGCGNICPSGAITYLGEDTGWLPPRGQPAIEHETCGCGCGNPSACADDSVSDSACDNDTAALKTVTIDYLYLDLTSCDRCIGTDQVLNEVVATITPALELAGYQVKVLMTEMATAEIAAQYQFLSSPTIRVNGKDIVARVTENHCGCCSTLSDNDVDCRVFIYEGKNYEVPPKQMLAEGILRVVFGEGSSADAIEQYSLPDNLNTFYLGKTKKACECGGDCSK